MNHTTYNLKTKQYKLEQSEYYPVSDIIINSLERYLNHKIEAGGFLMAVLCNDLFQAIGKADNENKYNLHNICGYIYNHIPASAWGSKEKVKEFLTTKE